jgi:hypothetical protein
MKISNLSFSKEIPGANLRVISLGAGVQSTVMALMAGMGKITPMPDCAIFADTQFEPVSVYDHLDWLEEQLPFPVFKVTAGNIKTDALNGINPRGKEFVTMPFYTTNGLGKRQCTSDYKIDPIRNKTRELLGLKKGERAKDKLCETWIGISTDEMQRVKESRDKYIINRFPLLELGMKRRDCHQWFDEYFPHKKLAKSACIACPYHDNRLWRDMKMNDPQSFDEAVEFDKKIRTQNTKNIEQFVHSSLKPLSEVDFSSAEDKGQLNFLDECDGMCGV